jgi:hypothetical protein
MFINYPFKINIPPESFDVIESSNIQVDIV